MWTLHVNHHRRSLIVAALGALLYGCSQPAPPAANDPVETIERPVFYCGRTYSELGPHAARPYNAVGFLNNGCTAVLIDANHIAAAGHCFVDQYTGQWMSGLRFYPNFHPSYVTADRAHVPRAAVTRIVGPRAWSPYAPGDGGDWGVATLGPWQDAGGMDLTPIQVLSDAPAVGTQVQNPAYNRHHLPYNDNDSVTWDNMQWDNKDPGGDVGGGCKPFGGQWAVVAKTVPFYDGVNKDQQWCNARWSSGFIHGNCTLRANGGDLIWHDCDASGGSSGSPVIYLANDIIGYALAGITHGGQSGLSDAQFTTPPPPDGGAPPASVCDVDGPNAPLHDGPSVARFADAPRFASNVAVHRRPDNPAATAVFAIDGDRGQVVYRSRVGSAPTYTTNFSWWSNLGTPFAGAPLTNIAACGQSGASVDKPQIFVTTRDGQLFSRAATSGTTWGSWSVLPLPGAAVIDVDAASDRNGRCALFVAANGKISTLARTADTTWGSWSTIAPGSFTRVTSINVNGTLFVAMIDPGGEIWHSENASGTWTTPVKLTRPPGVSGWADVDMTWSASGSGLLIAAPKDVTNNLYVQSLASPIYSGWITWTTHLYAPAVHDGSGALVPQPAPHMLTLTASRWMEDAAGVTSPVVFGTDDSGDIALIEYQRARTTPSFDLDWKPFYNEFVTYYQEPFESVFGSPNVGNGFQYNPPVVAGSQPWTFTSWAGVSGNGSGFTSGNASAPDGQVAFIQMTGSMQVTSPLLLRDTNYRLRLFAAQRANFQLQSQTVAVSVNGAQVGTIAPPSDTAYHEIIIPFSLPASGTVPITFQGQATQDGTVFIDHVRLELCPPGSC